MAAVFSRNPCGCAMEGRPLGLVSQHITVLRDAGLVTTHRNGRHVIAQRTELGDHFCP